MNIYVVRRATQGLANYIKKMGGEEKGLVISDAKNAEEAFSSDIAQYKKPYMPDTWFITHTEDVSI